MGTFPAVSQTPLPNEWQSLVVRQVLAAPTSQITLLGFSVATQNLTADIRVSKDGTAGAILFFLNAGGLVRYVMENATSAVITNVAAIDQTSIPLTYPAHTVAANRDGTWSVYVMQGPRDPVVFVHGGYFRGTSAVPVNFDAFCLVDLSGAKVTNMTVGTLSGSLAANSMMVVTGEAH